VYPLFRALLFLLPAEAAHEWGLVSLRGLGALGPVCRFLRRRTTLPGEPLAVRLGSLRFPNPIGLAAGLDKNAVAVKGLYALGFGAVEVGTLTPRPQPGNPKPRIFRVPEYRALINRLGFNNGGAVAARERLTRLSRRPAPLGVNLGKNKDTPLEEATEDYLAGVDAFASLCDYLVINASSPNTPGLRSLQEPEKLASLLTRVRARRDQVAPGTPLFLKIAPDLSLEAVDEIVDVARACRVEGLIATNTTVERPFAHPRAQEAGGLSGAPLREKSTAVIRRAFLRTRGELPVIGVGGIFTAEDVYEKIRAGASLVQVYTGFVYEGPGFVHTLLSGLERLLQRDGLACVEDAVGLDAVRPSALPIL